MGFNSGFKGLIQLTRLTLPENRSAPIEFHVRDSPTRFSTFFVSCLTNEVGSIDFLVTQVAFCRSTMISHSSGIIKTRIEDLIFIRGLYSSHNKEQILSLSYINAFTHT